jgi:hypothetical protein
MDKYGKLMCTFAAVYFVSLMCNIFGSQFNVESLEIFGVVVLAASVLGFFVTFLICIWRL